MPHGRFIAVDWGTTNRRAWLIDNGSVLDAQRGGPGILSVPAGGYEAEMAKIRARFGDHPALLAGMVGSNRGWVDAGYVAAPATLATIAGAVREAAPAVRIVPGVRTPAGSRPDVMRGEEVQFLGAVAAGLAPADALLAQPGTHNKWARVEAGAIASFTTAMTGELFALLKAHSLVGQGMSGTATDGPAFRDGLSRARDGDLLAALFEGRAASVLATRSAEDITSFISGLLIGADVNAQATPGTLVHLLADRPLGALYAAAIAEAGGTAQLVDSESAFLAGISRLWTLLP